MLMTVIFNIYDFKVTKTGIGHQTHGCCYKYTLIHIKYHVHNLCT